MRLANTRHLPFYVHRKEWVQKGGFISYSPDLAAVGPLAAGYVDKILKGAKPVDLPVQEFSQYELVINLKTAKALGVTAGIASIPLQNGQPMPPQAFEQLQPGTRAELEQRGKQVQAEVGISMRQMRQIEKEAQERVTALDRQLALFVAGPLIAELTEEFGQQPDVLAFIEQIEKDLPEHLHDFRPAAETEQSGPVAARVLQRQERLARYEVNVLIDNSETIGAPVVVERNPTYYNLIGARTIAP
jgi:AAA domain/ABC transporter substrate binding protein